MFINNTENVKGKLTEKDEEIIYYYRKLDFNISVEKTIAGIILNGEEIKVEDNKKKKIEIKTSQIEKGERTMTMWSKEVFLKYLFIYMDMHNETQRELASVIGVSSPTINDWANGKKFPRIDKVEMLANHYGILKSDLIEDKSEKHYEMQKNNDTITDAVVKMRTNEEFLTLIERLIDLDDEQIKSVNQMLNAFIK